MIKNRAVLVDGNSLIFRAFYALPPLTNEEGIATNGVYGFLTMLFKILDEYEPEFLSVAFDKKGKTFRHSQYEAYKAGRKETPNELLVQFPIVKEFLDAMGIHRIEMDDYEADDLVATLAKCAEKEGMEVLLVTGDRDYLQLISEQTKVLLMRKGISQIELFDENHFREVYELEVSSFVHLKALMGDASDNIPGVPGIGEKTGIKLLKEYKTVENLYENIDRIKGKMKEKLDENREMAYMSYRMSLMVEDLPVSFSKDMISMKSYDQNQLHELLKRFNFNSFLSRFGEKEQVALEDLICHSNSIEEILLWLKDVEVPYLKLHMDNGNYRTGNLLAMLLADQNQIFYLSASQYKVEEMELLLQAISDRRSGFIGHETKEELLYCKNKGCEIFAVGDTMIAEYLIHASENNYDLDRLASKYLGLQAESREDFFGKGKKMLLPKEIEETKLQEFAVRQMDILRKVYPKQLEIIKREEMDALFYQIEMPLVSVLAEMELEGIQTDEQKLKEIGERLDIEIAVLEKSIYSYGKKTFNINSPKQLGEILFEELQLPVGKKTKTGYSTNSEVLEKLQDKHPIITDIMAYRQLTKLKSTYIEGLLKGIEEDGRIHSSFMQTVASTGRISSTEPNLQNIPVRTKQGREIRKVFVAKEGYCLVDADYSQIELRVLADLSKDPKMLDAFNRNQDIHRRTAAEVFHISEEEVSSEMRTRAKAVNFGIVYGISDFGLSRDLNIPVRESKKLIENYFHTYPNIKQYMDNAIFSAKENGYATTLFHRKRALPELKSSNYQVRSFGERVAMNMPIQGTAADIIKIAMVNVCKALQEGNYHAKLILQVHDELIVEAREDEAEMVSKLVKEAMETAVSMSVSLDVDLKTGGSWYETK